MSIMDNRNEAAAAAAVAAAAAATVAQANQSHAEQQNMQPQAMQQQAMQQQNMQVQGMQSQALQQQNIQQQAMQQQAMPNPHLTGAGIDRTNSPHGSESSHFSGSRSGAPLEALNGMGNARPYGSPAPMQQPLPVTDPNMPPGMMMTMAPMLTQGQGLAASYAAPPKAESQPPPKAYPCSTCGKGFARRSDLARHGMLPHNNQVLHTRFTDVCSFLKNVSTAAYGLMFVIIPTVVSSSFNVLLLQSTCESTLARNLTCVKDAAR